jgi:hypothetical protein
MKTKLLFWFDVAWMCVFGYFLLAFCVIQYAFFIVDLAIGSIVYDISGRIENQFIKLFLFVIAVDFIIFGLIIFILNCTR